MMVIWIGFAMNAFVALASHLVSILPPPLSEENQAISESFNLLFAMVPRTTAASLTAFIFGSHFNAWVMSTMKIKSAGKGFGWRAIISTIAGEFTDSNFGRTHASLVIIINAYLGHIHLDLTIYLVYPVASCCTSIF